MKKFAIASALALAAIAASAVEVGVTSTTDYSGKDARQGFGATVSQSYGKVTATAGFERFTKGANDQDRFSLVGGYNVAKFGPATVAVKTGVAYLNNQVGHSGYAMTVGAGVSVPVTKQVSVGVDVARQYGQSRVQSSDGNAVTAGVNYRF
jgi:outer membrane autotransporter protein